MDILISLLVPTLGQRESELKRLLDSLVAQSYKNIEIIVVSQDNHNIVSNQCDAYRNCLTIKHITSAVKGLSLARNVGLHEVAGDIIILSDDDCWYPTNAIKREDMACWLSILKNGEEAHCLHECLAQYKVHSNSVSSNKLKMMKYQWQVYRKVERINVFKSIYYLAYWAVMGVLKYR